MRGRIDELDALATRFQRFPQGPGSDPCNELGPEVGTRLSVLFHDPDHAEVLIIDGSGRLQHFDGDDWVLLSDPANAPGGESFRCRLSFFDVTWLGPGEAIAVSRALGPWPVTHVSLKLDGTVVLADDGFPRDLTSTYRFLNLGSDGIYAVASPRGEVLMREPKGWSVLDDRVSLGVGDVTITVGPGGALLFGSRDDGIRQYWRDYGTCQHGLDGVPISIVTRLGRELLATITNLSTLTISELDVWRMRAPSACEVFPN
jgi:hypothetical protein